jgi:hypothetical protein
MQAMQPPETVNIFYCYAHEDKSWQDKLQKHLSNLKRQKLINDRHYRDIKAGQDWQKTINTYLENAHIIILLISPDFMASDYCHSIEMMRAMERHENGEAWVIPILLKSVDFTNAPFSHLQRLPRGQKGVAEWNSGSRDRIFTDIVLEIRKVIFDILDKPDPVDEQFEQFVLIDNTPKSSRSTRAASPSASTRGRISNKSIKQNPAQVLADTHTIKRYFPKTYKKSILDEVKELLRDIKFSDFIRLNPKKFKRYRRGRIRSSGWFFFFAFDVALASWGTYNWAQSSYVAIATFIILLIFFLWNSINESTFAGVVLTLLFTGIWCGLGALYLQDTPFIHAQFFVIIITSLFFSYLRFELFKPTR